MKGFDDKYEVKSYWNFSHNRKGGVAVILFGRTKSLLKAIERDYMGRIGAIQLKTGVEILNIYAPVRSPDQVPFFSELDDYVNNARKLVVLWDFNYVENNIANRNPPKTETSHLERKPG